jgi:hypothetical protein
MLIEKTFAELVEFFKKYFRTYYYIFLFPSFIMSAPRKGEPSATFLNHRIFLAVNISLYLLLSVSLVTYKLDIQQALLVFISKLESNSEFATVLSCIPVILVIYLYSIVISRILIKNRRERRLLRHIFYYWAGLQVMIYILLLLVYYVSWQILKVGDTARITLYKGIYVLYYGIPSLMSFALLYSRYNLLSKWSEKMWRRSMICSVLYAIAVAFATDVVYQTDSLLLRIVDRSSHEIILKGTLHENLLVAENIEPWRHSTDSNPPQNFHFDVYIYNKSTAPFMLDQNDTARLRYFTSAEYKSFQWDTMKCRTTEAVRNDTIWYKLVIIGNEDLVKYVTVLPGDLKRITLQMIEKPTLRPFRLENCYPYKMLQIKGHSPEYNYFDQKYEWKEKIVQQIVAFQSRFKNESP